MKPLYVFWKYDLYPYCLGSEVNDIGKNGCFKVKQYGGPTVKPLIVLEKSEGINLQKEIDELNAEYQEELEKLKKEYKEKLYAIAPFAKPSYEKE